MIVVVGLQICAICAICGYTESRRTIGVASHRMLTRCLARRPRWASRGDQMPLDLASSAESRLSADGFCSVASPERSPAAGFFAPAPRRVFENCPQTVSLPSCSAPRGVGLPSHGLGDRPQPPFAAEIDPREFREKI